MKRKHCQKSMMNGRFCKILRESSKKGENIFVGVSSCAKGQKRVFCSGSAEKSSKKVVEIFGKNGRMSLYLHPLNGRDG